MTTVRYTQIYNTHFRPLGSPSFTAEFSSSQYDYIGDLGYMNYFSGDQLVTYTAPNSKLTRTMPFTQDEILLIMQSYYAYQYILKDGRAFYHYNYGGTLRELIPPTEGTKFINICCFTSYVSLFQTDDGMWHSYYGTSGTATIPNIINNSTVIMPYWVGNLVRDTDVISDLFLQNTHPFFSDKSIVGITSNILTMDDGIQYSGATFSKSIMDATASDAFKPFVYSDSGLPVTQELVYTNIPYSSGNKYYVKDNLNNMYLVGNTTTTKPVTLVDTNVKYFKSYMGGYTLTVRNDGTGCLWDGLNKTEYNISNAKYAIPTRFGGSYFIDNNNVLYDVNNLTAPLETIPSDAIIIY